MPSSPLIHSAFYRFTPLPDAPGAARRVREVAAGVLGTVLVAAEGISGAVAAEAAALDAFEGALVDDPYFRGRLAGMAFKRSACRTPPFARLKVHCKPEIVAVGVPAGPVPEGASVSPAAWRALIARDDVVVIDNRNSFEFRLGRFRGALDPGVSSFRDFPAFIEAHAAGWAAAGKRVAMYCTGGIRCEKTSAWMHGLGLRVSHLEGGILNYFQSMPDAPRDWDGQCFVFDNRIALDSMLHETGATAEDVYAHEPDGAWRLARARRLRQEVQDADGSELLVPTAKA